MAQNLDVMLIDRLSKLEDLKHYFEKANDSFAQGLRSRFITPAPNLVEIALTHARSPNRMAYWLNRDLAKSQATIALPPVLALRASFETQLSQLKITSRSRIRQVATYLACTPCPTTSDLAVFARIHANTARRWLLRLGKGQILLVHATVNQTFCANVPLLKLLTSLDPKIIAGQFEATVQRPDWVKRSIYSIKT